MASEQLKETLEKVPVMLLLTGYLLYLGYDYYSFTRADDSELLQKQAQLKTLGDDVTKLRGKISALNDFRKNLEAKKVTLRQLSTDLDAMKTTLSETLDVPEFMKATITEARKVGLTVLALKPTTHSAKEYYAEQSFDFAFRGVYAQLLVFLDRLSNMQRILGINNFELKPISSSSARYVELMGTIELKAYRYLGSKADEFAKTEARK